MAKIGLLNFYWNSNRGAILTSYAFQEVLNELGYTGSKVIQYMPYCYYQDIYLNNSISKRFAEKWMDLTPYYADSNDLRVLNKEFDTFICASDQIWRYEYTKDFEWIYFFKFAEAIKKLIAYSVSFGTTHFNAPANKAGMTKYFLDRFDFISTREDSGTNILKDTFNIEGQWTIDPVFLIDWKKYDTIAETSKLNIDGDYILVYKVGGNKTKNFEDNLEKFKKIVGLDRIIYITPEMGVEDWLYCIKHAKYVYTDSFHASCFSLIFKTKFFTFYFRRNSESRMTSLEKFSGLKDFYYFLEDELDEERIKKAINEDLDYETIYKNINKFKEYSINWLKNAIDSSKVKNVEPKDLFIDGLLEEMDTINKKATDWDYNKQFVKFKENPTHKVINILGIECKFKIKK